MRLVRVKSWCALVVLLGSVALGLSTAAIVPCSRLVADGGADLRGTVALRVALLTSPGHDPHRPANPIVAWAAALDRAGRVLARGSDTRLLTHRSNSYGTDGVRWWIFAIILASMQGDTVRHY